MNSRGTNTASNFARSARKFSPAMLGFASRWARFGDSKPYHWVPIPRDRDQAFALYDGLLLKVARASTPQLVKFGPKYAGPLGQNWNGRFLDRRFLVSLERKDWDSIATALQSRLTDSVIEAAAGRLPPRWTSMAPTAMKSQRCTDWTAASPRYPWPPWARMASWKRRTSLAGSTTMRRRRSVSCCMAAPTGWK